MNHLLVCQDQKEKLLQEIYFFQLAMIVVGNIAINMPCAIVVMFVVQDACFVMVIGVAVAVDGVICCCSWQW